MPLLPFLRQRIGFVMVAIVLVVCFGLLIHQRLVGSTPQVIRGGVADESLAPRDPAELRAQWEAAVTSILTDYDRTQDARSARERLLAVRVPASAREAHLALFLAFNGLMESRADAKTKLTTARTAFQRIVTMSAASSTTPLVATPTSTR